MKRKIFLPILMTVALIVTTFGGCATKASDNNSSAKTVNLLVWLGDNITANWQKADIAALNSFTKANPNITVRTEIVATDGINSKISVAAATNTLPDIQDAAPTWVLMYGGLGKLVPLDGLFDKTDFDASLLTTAFSTGGKLYVLPMSAGCSALIINKTLFEKDNALGLVPPDINTPWTTAQFMKAAKAVTNATAKTYGFGMHLADQDGDQVYHMFMWAFGASSFNSTDTQCTLNTPEAVAGMQFMVSLADAKVVPPGCVGINGAQMDTMIVNGQIGMFKASPGDLAYYVQAMKDAGTNWDFVQRLFPSENGDTSYTYAQRSEDVV